jgi:hypothetical protein
MAITITEALAEIKTVQKRIEKKREFIGGFLARQDGIKDPLEKDGGSFQAITRERQAIGDLENRIVTLRRGIQAVNESTTVTINGISRSIADWLVWRRDVAPGHQQFLGKLRASLNSVREQARKQGAALITTGSVADKPTDIVVNINEQDLAAEIEKLEDTLGQLDGQLSLKNATVPIAA